MFVRALRDAVRNTLFDVKFEDDVADSTNRRFRRRQLLKNRDTETRLLDHFPNSAELALDALEARQHIALMIDIKRGRARPPRRVDYSMRVQSGSVGLFVGHLKQLTAASPLLFTRWPRPHLRFRQVRTPRGPCGLVEIGPIPIDDDNRRKRMNIERVERFRP